MSKLTKMKVEGLKSLRETEITFAKQGCTSLVGANDSGKTSLLYALHLFFTDAAPAEEELNPRCREPHIACVLDIPEEEARKPFNLRPGQYLITRKLTGDRKYRLSGINEAKTAADFKQLERTRVVKCFPSFILIHSEKFSYRLGRADHKSSFQRVLARRFNLVSPSGPIRQREIQDEAEQQINELLENVWKSSLRRNLTYIPVGEAITYSISDTRGQRFPVSHVGDGFQRVVSLALQIEAFLKATGDTDRVIAIDEPENSLHPQAQRQLFHFLEQLPNTQTCVATHSPTMTNTSRPRNIRTVFFDPEKDTTVVWDRKHLYDNYETIRLALGVLPTDSLSYGFGNVIVEGTTDFVVYPIWARKLREAGRTDLDLALVRFIHGGGSSVPDFFRIALSTGLPTVVMVDNDEAGRDYARKVREFIERSKYRLEYEPVHFLKVGDGDADLEQTLPAEYLVRAINEKCHLNPEITLKDLTATPRVKRSENIKEFLANQQVKYSEVKTQISIAVAESMQVDEIPKSVMSFFSSLSEILSKRTIQVHKA